MRPRRGVHPRQRQEDAGRAAPRAVLHEGGRSERGTESVPGGRQAEREDGRRGEPQDRGARWLVASDDSGSGVPGAADHVAGGSGGGGEAGALALFAKQLRARDAPTGRALRPRAEAGGRHAHREVRAAGEGRGHQRATRPLRGGDGGTEASPARQTTEERARAPHRGEVAYGVQRHSQPARQGWRGARDHQVRPDAERLGGGGGRRAQGGPGVWPRRPGSHRPHRHLARRGEALSSGPGHLRRRYGGENARAVEAALAQQPTRARANLRGAPRLGQRVRPRGRGGAGPRRDDLPGEPGRTKGLRCCSCTGTANRKRDRRGNLQELRPANAPPRRPLAR